MKRNTLKHSIATLLVVLAVAVLGAGNALAHQAVTQSAISFSANPVPAGTTVTITGTVTYTGTFGGGPSNGHTVSNGQAVVGENLQIQQAVDAGGNPVACEDPNLDDFVTIDQGDTNSSGQFSTTFDTTNKGGQTLGFRSHHPAGTGAGPGHSSGQSASACVNLVITAAEGCSQGFWSTHTGLGPQGKPENEWGPTGYTTTTTLQGPFQINGTAFATVYSTSTLLEALNFPGGPGDVGGFLILMKQAVAALLNAAHPAVAYPRTEAGVIADVNAALAAGDRATMLALEALLNIDNNLGCPLPLEE